MANKIDISKLSIQELIELNHQIQERFSYLKQAESYKALSRFDVGDRVSFKDHDGAVIKGTIMRLNKKSVTIVADDKRGWKVDPMLLNKIGSNGEKSQANLFNLVKN